ncbi:unnamed protein product [Cochlearia groenlandica]
MADYDIFELLWHTDTGHIVYHNHPQRPTSDKPSPPPPILLGSGSSGQGRGRGGGEEDENSTIPQQKPFQQNLFIQEDEMAPWLQPQVPFSLTQQPPQLSSQYNLPLESPAAAGRFTNFSTLRANILTGGRVTAGPSAPVVRESTHVGSSATSSSSTIDSGLGGKDKEVVTETVREMAGTSSSRHPNAETELKQIQPAREMETADDRRQKTRDETIEEIEGTHNSTARNRSLSAEKHNLSEKRRRGKINEKIKALRELIRCNKSEKASVLDDVIGYVKFLEMQLQMMMMMGGNTTPMMYPNMAMGMPGMNQPPPPFIPFPGLSFPRPPHITGQGPSYLVPQPNLVPNQAQFPAYMNPYSQFVGHHQMQQTPPLQNQTTSELSLSQESCSNELEDQDNQPRG